MSISFSDQCVDIRLETRGDGGEISWTFGPCSSDQVYASNKPYIQQCCLATGEYHLTCKDSYGDGWKGAFIEIQGKKYCDDFRTGSVAIQKVTIEGIYSL